MTEAQTRECGIIIHYFSNFAAIGKAKYSPGADIFDDKRLMHFMAVALAEVFGITPCDDDEANDRLHTLFRVAADKAFDKALDKGVRRLFLGSVSKHFIENGVGDIVAAATSASFIETAGWILADMFDNN